MQQFSKKYKIFILLIICLIAGFALLAGPSGNNAGFSTTMFSFRRISLAPIIIMVSYAGFIWLILKKPSD
ncbi:MAG: hypothetical protein A2W90_15730 [Bacteroidetes bacterium GWF2_42_66]|nr:MAG: hypothetical protein A2W92_08260 [Bacteroidetes bacterium GWA2_42_15]OFY02707.1 MAG: hypothetical protein A2W89_04315 [Bacteroidetes bacterium GWE2_42_39]OFY43906.1 MAG: hypothetical protein A2W90_15730 [Bacteroidetes bacterium GWF2_42_66]HBL77570.1 DUF3098 domain-containing protein [Prolixibacteraceae bacterium]HCR90655.1 DUF3098 domain-containing protein [Prolixibacteraceae bacterium]